MIGSKESIMDKTAEIQNIDVLEFVIFCIEYVATELGVHPEDVYKALTEASDILYSYIVPCYDVLHTQSKDYIVEDILHVMEEKGIVA
ncbi:MAG: DUF3791 domain-containing protein [Veillonella sp.]|nr:DUF3791 domain-containing protein [Veillonella sp.]MBP9624361.1 DUF3791 domain-containing protein [Veillonella sp.]